MTVIIGVQCTDGVVIGSDSSATIATGGGQYPTIEIGPVTKVRIVAQSVVFASTGAGGLAQRFAEVLQATTAPTTFRNKNAHEAGKAIASAAIAEFSSTNCPKGQFGALVGFKCASGFCLCEYPPTDFQPEWKTAELWFASMGAGQPITDPFLAFLKKVLFQGTQPSVSEGALCVAWALEHVIELNTGGINGPSQIAVLSNDARDRQPRARLLDDDEISAHLDYVRAAESHLGQFRTIFRQMATNNDPQPIPPSAT